MIGYEFMILLDTIKQFFKVFKPINIHVAQFENTSGLYPNHSFFFFPNHSLFCSLFVFVCFRHSDGYMVFYWGFNLHSPMTNEVKQLFFLFWPLDSLFCKVCLNCLPIFLFCYHFIDPWEFFILNAGHLLVMCLTNIMSHFISYLLILLMESLMKTNFKSQYSTICHFFSFMVSSFKNSLPSPRW